MVIELKIEKVVYGGYGLGNHKGIKVFIPYTCPEEIIRAEITEKKKGYWFGELKEIIEPSPLRIKPLCQKFTICGGCDFQHMEYPGQLVVKKLLLNDALSHIGKIILPVKNPFPAKEWGYRNKIQMIFGNGNKLKIGYYQKKSHNLVDCPTCPLQPKVFDQIREVFFQRLSVSPEKIYSEEKKEGNLRYLVLKRGEKTGEVLITIVSVEPVADRNLFAELNGAMGIVGILNNINPFPKNRILTDDFRIISGRDYYFENILDKRFKISAGSFFQINTPETERLAKKVLKFLEPKGDEVVLDLFSGVGTFSLIVANFVGKVIGIEIVPSAVKDALTNKEINGVDNVDFILGDCEKAIDSFSRVDKVIIDPPRKGISSHLLQRITALKPEIIVYVSCNPATLARDLKLFSDYHYEPVAIEMVDMFPQTYHIESIAKVVPKG
jgi:23S rRNA (uracil1939-C5)-methyltransferase